jgi:RNA polymerase sigma factor (sigma-70 family)
MEKSRRPRKGRYVVAMVLGTALSALGSASVASPAEARAVNDISRYCTTCWRNARLDPNSWTDCTQDVFCRLLERLGGPESWERVLQVEGEERREFLRAIDAVKKRTQRGRKWSSTALEAVPDSRDSRERRLADTRQAVQEAAVTCLSQKQHQILNLSFDGWSVHDISKEMRLSPERVSDEKYKAIRKLRAHFLPAEMS